MGMTKEEFEKLPAHVRQGLAAAGQLPKGWEPPPAQPPEQPAKSVLKLLDDGYDSEWERQYAKHLQLQLLAGEILAWWPHSQKFRMADRTWYSIDFTVKRLDGRLEFVEVKGFKRDDAMVKFKTCAELYAGMGAFVMIQKGQGGQGGWKEIARHERAIAGKTDRAAERQAAQAAAPGSKDDSGAVGRRGTTNQGDQRKGRRK